MLHKFQNQKHSILYHKAIPFNLYLILLCLHFQNLSVFCQLNWFFNLFFCTFRGKLNQALDLLTEAILLNPHSAILYATRGTILYIFHYHMSLKNSIQHHMFLLSALPHASFLGIPHLLFFS